MADVSALIMREADGLILVNKPAGVPTASNKLDEPGSLQFDLMAHYRRMIWAVHQLDRDTSGLNVFVRRKKLVQVWVDAMKRGGKTYLAICRGRVEFDRRVVDLPLGWLPEQRRRGPLEEGQPAKTVFEVLDRAEDATLLSARLLTGRTHQIRLHLEHLGHPLLGEQRYVERSCKRAGRQMLHAWRLDANGQRFEAPVPADMSTILDELGLTLHDPSPLK